MAQPSMFSIPADFRRGGAGRRDLTRLVFKNAHFNPIRRGRRAKI